MQRATGSVRLEGTLAWDQLSQAVAAQVLCMSTSCFGGFHHLCLDWECKCLSCHLLTSEPGENGACLLFIRTAHAAQVLTNAHHISFSDLFSLVCNKYDGDFSLPLKKLLQVAFLSHSVTFPRLLLLCGIKQSYVFLLSRIFRAPLTFSVKRLMFILVYGVATPAYF